MTTQDGRKFAYVCPKCGRDVEGCPDPACRGVGHHTGDDGSFGGYDGCDDDVPLSGCPRRYLDDNPTSPAPQPE